MRWWPTMNTTTLHNTQTIDPTALNTRMATGAAWHAHCLNLETFELQVELALRDGATAPSMAWRQSQIAQMVLAGRLRGQR